MKVLIAVDGSESSKLAVQHCLASQWEKATEFRIISVIDFFEPLVAMQQEKEHHITRLQELVKTCQAEIEAKLPGMPVSSEVLDGYTKTLIVKEAGRWRADLIVLGCRGMSNFKRILLGSVSQSVLNNASCSVRIVKAAENREKSEVVVALDRSECSKAALNQVLCYPWPDGTSFTVVSAIPDLSQALDEQNDLMQEFVQKQASLIAEEAGRVVQEGSSSLKSLPGGFPVEFVTPQGDAREEILRVAESKGATMIFLGSHSRDAIERMMIGSVSEGVAIHAPCSVEVVRSTNHR